MTTTDANGGYMAATKYDGVTRTREYWIDRRRVSGAWFALVALARRDGWMLRCWWDA